MTACSDDFQPQVDSADVATVAIVDIRYSHRTLELLENAVARGRGENKNGGFNWGSWDAVNGGRPDFPVTTEETHGDIVVRCMLESLEKADHLSQVSLVIIDVSGEEGGSVEDVTKAVKYAENQGSLFCNLSFSLYAPNRRLFETLEESRMLFVVAAGNEGENLDLGFPSYPSLYQLDNVVSVAAVNDENALLNDSNYGHRVVDAAMNGLVEMHDGREEIGTSAAAPRVTASLVSYLLDCGFSRSKEIDKNMMLRDVSREDASVSTRFGLVD